MNRVMLPNKMVYKNSTYVLCKHEPSPLVKFSRLSYTGETIQIHGSMKPLSPVQVRKAGTNFIKIKSGGYATWSRLFFPTTNHRRSMKLSRGHPWYKYINITKPRVDIH
ncbi:hypothetical protein BDA96_07G125000 [Sorghum bicolor]|uniref:Uncharacterized protein n=2 Tax=Sorghum bicolor TaxID=4558 RepID=A0A1B6PHA6_SORBI|nr:hypothetical protein BDA96_07G125000 [Sorghum bicolor]KXG25074.1 hypothetical protein SORBI_3007G116300 [Sorghum bicolor]